MTTTTTATTTAIEPLAGFVGNVATTPELRQSSSGVAYLRMRLAVRPYHPKSEPRPEPEFYDVVAFGNLAANVAATCRHGDRVVVSGRAEYSTWTGNDGRERTTRGIVADAIGFDMRFTGAPETKPAPAPPRKPPGIITELVGPAPATDYTNEPF